VKGHDDSTTFFGRVALITGGSRGIGRATALRLASEGADVAISYVSRREEAESVVRQIREIGRRAIAVTCNVAHSADIQRLVKQTREQLGPIDLLVHSGAISNTCEHTELTEERWLETIDINLSGTYRVVFAVKDEMIQRRYGRIVTISSLAALRPRPMQIHYSAAKAGVISFTRSCAEAFAAHHVRFNCVAPGLIDTEMVRVLPDDRIASIVAQTPIRRLGQPEEVASAIRFLLSDESSFITGQTLMVCGGRVMLPG
jgi:3-oxoacyl-[acyl-carrier protein] reductase